MITKVTVLLFVHISSIQTEIYTTSRRSCLARTHSPPYTPLFRFIANNDLRTVTVVDKVVGGAATGAGNEAALGEGEDAATDGSGAGKTLELDQVGSETSNVGSGHRGTGEGGSGGVTSVVGGEDGRTRGEHIEGGAVVGVRGAGISGGGSTDSDSVGSRGGGVVGGVGVVVTGSDDKGNTSGDGGLDGGVQGSGVGAAEGEVGNRLLAGTVGGNPLHTGDNTGGGAGTAVVEDLDTDEGGLLGHTVGGASDGTGDVGAVAVAVTGGAAGNVGANAGTAAELRVGGADTLEMLACVGWGSEEGAYGVNDVDGHALASGGVVDVAGGALGLAGDTAETPGSIGLSGLHIEIVSFRYIKDRVRGSAYQSGGLHDLVLLDVGNLRAAGNLVDGGLVEGTGVALEGADVVLVLETLD